MGPLYKFPWVPYMFPVIVFLPIMYEGGPVEVGEVAKEVAVADFGAVLRPASR